MVGVQREPQVSGSMPFSTQQKTPRAREVVEWSHGERTAGWGDVAGREKNVKLSMVESHKK